MDMGRFCQVRCFAYVDEHQTVRPFLMKPRALAAFPHGIICPVFDKMK